MKVKVNTKLVTESVVLEEEMFGLFRNNKLQFLEKEVKVILDFEKQMLVRDDEEKRLTYKFRENEETLNEVFLHQEKLKFMVPIITKKFQKKDTFCEIVYNLGNGEQDVYYQIRWEEVK